MGLCIVLGHSNRCSTGAFNTLYNKAHAEMRSNLPMLRRGSLYGDRVPYNVCRNLEWQVCAAQGMLPGQGGRVLKFAKAPATLQPLGGGGKPLGQCCGWVPPDMNPLGGIFGYATDDIYYLEACVLSQICQNSEELFQLAVGDPFICDFSREKFVELQELLLSPWSEPSGAAQCASSKTCIEIEPGKTPSCPECWRINEGGGDCSTLPGCNK